MEIKANDRRGWTQTSETKYNLSRAMIKSDSVRKTGKTTLLVVVRDYDAETPLDMLKEMVEEDIRQIWADVAKPQDRQGAQFSDYFNVGFIKEIVKDIRVKKDIREIWAAVPKSQDRQGAQFSDYFNAIEVEALTSFRYEKEKFIQEDMLARAHCDEIAQGILASLRDENEEWKTVQEHVRNLYDPELGEQLKKIADGCLSEYDDKTLGFNEVVRKLKRDELESNLFQTVHPAYENAMENRCKGLLEIKKNGIDDLLERKQSADLDGFVKEMESIFNRECEDAAIKEAGWDASKIKDRFQSDIRAYIKQKENEPILATAQCGEIASGILVSLRDENEEWKTVQEHAQSHYDPELGTHLNEIVSWCLSEYDARARTFNEVVRRLKRNELKSNLFREVYPAYQNAIDNRRKELLDLYKNGIYSLLGEQESADLDNYVKKMESTFDKECEDAAIKEAEWDASRIKAKFQMDIRDYIKLQKKEIEVQEKQISLSMKACAHIVQDLLDSLRNKNEGWEELQERVRETYVEGFGKFLRELVDVYLSKYDKHAKDCVESVRTLKRNELESSLFRIVYPAYGDAVDALHRQLLKVNKKNIRAFVQKERFEDLVLYVEKMVVIFADECKDAGIKEAEWDASKMIKRFLDGIGAFIEERLKKEAFWDKVKVTAVAAGGAVAAAAGVVMVALSIAGTGGLALTALGPALSAIGPIIGQGGALAMQSARKVSSSAADEKTKCLVPVRGWYPCAYDVGGTSALQQAEAKDSK